MNSMTTRNFYTLFILALVLPIGELSSLWQEGGLFYDGLVHKLHPFPLLKDYEISVTWYTYFMGQSIANILTAWIIFRCSRMNQIFRVAATVFLIFRCVDFIMFLLNNNQGSYIFIYSLAGLAIIVVAYRKSATHSKERVQEEMQGLAVKRYQDTKSKTVTHV